MRRNWLGRSYYLRSRYCLYKGQCLFQHLHSNCSARTHTSRQPVRRWWLYWIYNLCMLGYMRCPDCNRQCVWNYPNLDRFQSYSDFTMADMVDRSQGFLHSWISSSFISSYPSDFFRALSSDFITPVSRYKILPVRNSKTHVSTGYRVRPRKFFVLANMFVEPQMSSNYETL